MVRKRQINRLACFLAAVFVLGLSGTSNAQLLFKPEMEIENYAYTGYHLYGRTQIARSSNPRYDYFGNYLLNGVQVFHWDEEKINSRHIQLDEKNSVLDKLNPVDQNEFFHFYLDDLVVLNETTKAFSSRFIVGNEIRAKFSPLTLDMAALNGIRWDFDVKDNYITLVSSRADMPLWFSNDMLLQESRERLIPVYLTGAHIQREVGIFNVSANYVNTYKTDSAQSRQANSITGTISNDTQLAQPLRLVMKIEDASRYNAGGPRVLDIIPVVNGRERRELIIGVTSGTWKNDFTAIRKQNDPNQHLYTSRYFLDPLRVPDYYEFSEASKNDPLPSHFLTKRFSLTDPLIKFSNLNEEGENYLECNGDEYLLFWFAVPQDEDVKSYKFKVLIGNNYIISLSEVYANVKSNFQTTELGGANATYFQPVARAQGDVKDMSNLRWVTVEHGNPTANMLMGVRIDSEVKGFKFVSEYSRNMQFKQYSNQKAHKLREDADAYYINIRKELGKFTFGTEYFKLDPNYTTSFKNVDTAYNDVKSAWQAEFSNDPTQRGNQYSASDMQYFMNLTQDIDTVDDNDDKDRYPDWHIYREVRDRNGVFPGLDTNGDNRPDTNQNDNLTPDYVEPFFLYSVDPDEYEFGLDLNNNSTIDVREDDSKPDYPYDLNRKGYHVFGSYGQDMGWKLTLGYLNFHRIAGGGENNVKYGMAEYNKFIPFFANLKFSTILKKSKDSIQDDIWKVSRELSTTLIDSTSYGYNLYDPTNASDPIYIDMISEQYYDPLRYRDSYAGNTCFETNVFRIQNLTVGIKLKYDINHQNETSFQKENDIIDRTQIYRAEYKYYLKDLLVNPQVKFMTRKFTNGDGYEMILHEQYFYPIIKVEYPLTLNTSFRAGAQGFPGLNAKVRNLVNNQLDYDTRYYVFMLSNKSFYSGYDFSLNFGFESNWQNFEGIARQAYNRTDRVYFVRLVVGLEPIS